MDKEILQFGFIEIESHKFYRYKSLIFLKNVDIENVLVSDRIFSGEKIYKYFICSSYDDYKIKPLHKMLPKTRAYVEPFDGQTKWMYF